MLPTDYLPMEYGEIPATRTWSEMIKQEIIMIKLRLTAIENNLSQLGVPTEGAREARGLFEAMGAGYARYEYKGEPMEEEETINKSDLVSTYVHLLMVRRALYGYGMLLTQMGLSKDQREVVKQLERMATTATRLMQTLKVLMTMMEMYEKGTLFGPYGMLLGLIAGGTLAASMAFSAKMGGGGN